MIVQTTTRNGIPMPTVSRYTIPTNQRRDEIRRAMRVVRRTSTSRVDSDS